MNDTVGAIKLQDNMRKSESFLGLAGYLLNKTIYFPKQKILRILEKISRIKQ